MLIATPFNVDLMGVAAWGVYSLISIITLIISRLDAGLALLIQMEAAEKRAESFQGGLFREAEFLHFLVLPFLAILFSLILMNTSGMSDVLAFALKNGVVHYLVLIAFVSFFSRLYEARLRGFDYEVISNTIFVLRMSVVATLPFFCIKFIGLEWFEVFQYILISEVTTLFILMFSQRWLASEKSFSPPYKLQELRKNIFEIKAAFKYQLVAFGSQGFDIILASIFLPLEVFGVFALAYTFSKLINSASQPLLNYASQEFYKSSEKVSISFERGILRLTFIASFLIFSTFGLFLELWIGGAIPQEVYPGIALLLLGKIIFLPFTPLILSLNKKREFESRMYGYLFSIVVFILSLLTGYIFGLISSIIAFCISMFLRDLSFCFFFYLYEKKGNLLKRSQASWFSEFLVLVAISVSLIGLMFIMPSESIMFSLAVLIFLLCLFRKDIKTIALFAWANIRDKRQV